MTEEQRKRFELIAKKYSMALILMNSFIDEEDLDFDDTWNLANQLHSNSLFETDNPEDCLQRATFLSYLKWYGYTGIIEFDSQIDKKFYFRTYNPIGGDNYILAVYQKGFNYVIEQDTQDFYEKYPIDHYIFEIEASHSIAEVLKEISKF